MGSWSFVRALALATACIAAKDALAQSQAPSGSPSPASAPRTTAGAGPGDLRGRFGIDMAARLLKSPDPDERLRGLERAAALRTTEALVLLERASKARVPGTSDAHLPLEGWARRDPRALLVVVRGLAGWLDREPARAALASIVDAPAQSFDTHASAAGAQPSIDPTAEDAEGSGRVLLARQEAAIAIAESGNLLALESLIAIARSAGAGQGPALDALAIHPPPPPVLGGVVLTTPGTVSLAVTVGDLRSVDAIEAALSASDPSLRAAALVALGVMGDLRGAEAARASLHDRDARVRLAAGDMLARLGTRDAEAAIAALVADDATALDGLRLSQLLQGDSLTRAAAARAAVSAIPVLRAAAVAALGRQGGASAIDALTALAADQGLQGDAAYAIARSPSPAAMGALETMGETGALKRVAARGYFVRRWVRGERSRRLDALLADLAGSRDPRDRAVGAQALVALGERPVAGFLADGDASVRRAVALGAHALDDAESRQVVLSRIGVEPDEATRQVLSIGLVGGDASGTLPTSLLRERMRAGGSDAPLATLAFMQRVAGEFPAEVDAMLSSFDPVLRAHVARGLGASGRRDALGRLARAFAQEGDVQVRRAIVAALAAAEPGAGGEEALASERVQTLDLAARLDPDRLVRWSASRALSAAPPSRSGVAREVTWLRLVPAEKAVLLRDMTAMLVLSDGLALPIAFDDDGYALVPGVPPGEAQLRLAPRPPTYDALLP